MTRQYNVGMEMVAFQDHEFKNALTAEYDVIRQSGEDEKVLKDAGFLPTIAAVIKRFTNMDLKVSTIGLSPSVQVPSINRNHVFITQAQRRSFTNMRGKDLVASAKNGVVKGSVNIQTGKVHGVFEDTQSVIFMPAKYIKDERYTTAELAAITLHEIGHLFTHYEYITRTATTNQVLEGLSRELAYTSQPEQVEAVLISVREALKLKDLDVKELAKSSDKKTVELVVLTSVIEETKSQLGSDIYDVNSWEMLADNYAARHGAGKDLVVALSKLQGGIHSSYRSTGLFLFLEAVKLVTLFGSVAGLVGGMPLLAGLSYVTFSTLFALDLNTEYYDRPGHRARRIRDQVTLRLRDRDISAEEKKQLEDDLVLIDDVLKTINDRRQVLSLLSGVIFKSVRNRYRQEQLQSELEQLAHNDLFLIFPR